MTSGPRIAISICTYNRYDVLPKAIESAIEQSTPASQYRVIVVDNSSNREVARSTAATYRKRPQVTYLVEERAGLSNARNVSARECGTDFIAFMDDDAIADRDWIKEILNAFDSFGPQTAIVGGRVDPIWGAPRPPWLHDAMLGSLSVINWGGKARVAGPQEWFAGTNIAFRTDTILQNGGFSTGLGRIGSGVSLLSNEEVQLVARIQNRGSQLVYAPAARVGHLVDASRLTRTWFRRRAAWQAVSDFLMDGERFANEIPRYWEETVQYFNALPPHERTIRGLILDTDDPALFRWQTNATYMMTMMMLAGFQGANGGTVR